MIELRAKSLAANGSVSGAFAVVSVSHCFSVVDLAFVSFAVYEGSYTPIVKSR